MLEFRGFRVCGLWGFRVLGGYLGFRALGFGGFQVLRVSGFRAGRFHGLSGALGVCVSALLHLIKIPVFPAAK